MRQIKPPFWLLGSAILMTAAHYLFPVRGIVPTPFNLIGAALIVISLMIFGWSVFGIRRARTTIIPFRESTSLVTGGPFQFSRNPIYLSMVLLLLGIAFLFGSLSPFLIVPLFALIIDRVFILGEESMLRVTFADDYETYCRQVRRWI